MRPLRTPRPIPTRGQPRPLIPQPKNSSIRFAELRVLLHHDKRVDRWIAHALECDLVAQGADAGIAMGGILRQVAALAWIRLHGGDSPGPAPAALHTAWTQASETHCEAYPACLLHSPDRLQTVTVPLNVRRGGTSPLRLPGDPLRATSRKSLLAALAKRKRMLRSEDATLLGGWARPAPLAVLAGHRTCRPCELPLDEDRISTAVAGALLRWAC
jgi:hypothetical protein